MPFQGHCIVHSSEIVGLYSTIKRPHSKGMSIRKKAHRGKGVITVYSLYQSGILDIEEVDPLIHPS
jgi:hypothetical protein